MTNNEIYTTYLFSYFNADLWLHTSCLYFLAVLNNTAGYVPEYVVELNIVLLYYLWFMCFKYILSFRIN